MPTQTNTNNTSRKGTPQGRGGRGRGRGPRTAGDTHGTTTRRGGWGKLLNAQSINTNLLPTTKRGNDQRSPFDGDSQKKKALTAADISTKVPLVQPTSSTLITDTGVEPRAKSNPTSPQRLKNKKFTLTENTTNSTTNNTKHKNNKSKDYTNIMNNNRKINHNDVSTNITISIDKSNRSSSNDSQQTDMEGKVKKWEYNGQQQKSRKCMHS